MREKNIGGRPTKTETQKRKYPLNLKLTTIEYFSLKARAKEADLTQSECVRQAITKGVILQRITPEVLDLVRKLCGMANRLLARQTEQDTMMQEVNTSPLPIELTTY